MGLGGRGAEGAKIREKNAYFLFFLGFSVDFGVFVLVFLGSACDIYGFSCVFLRFSCGFWG